MLLYRVTAELVDGAAGIAAAALLLSLKQFRFFSMMVMSHGVMLLAALAMLYAWLRWRRAPTPARAALLGAVGGWAAITRPLDALCFALPIAVAMLWRMRRWPARRGLATVGVLAAAAAPFLVLQVIFNVGVTGNALESPVARYYRLYTPHMSVGFEPFDPAVRPATALAQRVEFYDTLVAPAAAEHRPGLVWRELAEEILPAVAEFALPSALLLIFLPPAMLALGGAGGGRGAFLATLPLLIAAYALLPFFLPHYVLPMSAALIFGVVLGWHALQETLDGRLRAWVVTSVLALLLLTVLRALPEFNRLVRDDDRVMPILDFDRRLAEAVEGRAILLYRYGKGANLHAEPVYNLQTVWPDDARIIRAHDRGAEQNAALYRHYARHQPDRKVFLVDRPTVETGRHDYRPQYLATVAELAAAVAAAERTPSTQRQQP